MLLLLIRFVISCPRKCQNAKFPLKAVRGPRCVAAILKMDGSKTVRLWKAKNKKKPTQKTKNPLIVKIIVRVGGLGKGVVVEYYAWYVLI